MKNAKIYFDITPFRTIKMKKECTLEHALNYKNEDVIFRFIKIFDITEKESLLIFEETKKWLWLCYKVAGQNSKTSVLIDDSMLIIDEMWHNFILFTKDYERYCIDKFVEEYDSTIENSFTKQIEMDGWKMDIVLVDTGM